MRFRHEGFGEIIDIEEVKHILSLSILGLISLKVYLWELNIV